MIYEIGDTTLFSRHTAIKMWEVSVEGGKRPLREHRHINFEISLVLEGTGSYNTARGIKEMAPGNLFVYTSNEPHCITDVCESGLRLLNLQFTAKALENSPLLDKSYPFIFYNHAGDFDCRLTDSPELTALLFRIREEFSQMAPGFSSIITGLIGEIFIVLIRKYGFYQSDTPSSHIIQKLEKGIAYINAHYCQELTLEEIAEQSSITPNYFSSLFRECLSMKLWDYITAKRIDRAKRLLRRPEMGLTVLDIAMECGFNNTANFNRAFKLHTGLTPSQYRSSHHTDLV